MVLRIKSGTTAILCRLHTRYGYHEERKEIDKLAKYTSLKPEQTKFVVRSLIHRRKPSQSPLKQNPLHWFFYPF